MGSGGLLGFSRRTAVGRSGLVRAGQLAHLGGGTLLLGLHDLELGRAVADLLGVVHAVGRALAVGAARRLQLGARLRHGVFQLRLALARGLQLAGRLVLRSGG